MNKIVRFAEDAKILWLLDSGHGEDTQGKRSPVWSDGSQLLEWEFNRDMSDRIRFKLRELGKRVMLVVQEEHDVSLEGRCSREKAARRSSKFPTVFISNHANAFEKEDSSGIEVFTSVGQTDSDIVAEHIAKHLFEAFPDIKRRVDKSDGDLDKEAHFYVLRNTAGPSVLIEYGFMTNEEECKKLLDPDWRNRAAEAVVQAMVKYECNL